MLLRDVFCWHVLNFCHSSPRLFDPSKPRCLAVWRNLLSMQKHSGQTSSTHLVAREMRHQLLGTVALKPDTSSGNHQVLCTGFSRVAGVSPLWHSDGENNAAKMQWVPRVSDNSISWARHTLQLLSAQGGQDFEKALKHSCSPSQTWPGQTTTRMTL